MAPNLNSQPTPRASVELRRSSSSRVGEARRIQERPNLRLDRLLPGASDAHVKLIPVVRRLGSFDGGRHEDLAPEGATPRISSPDSSNVQFGSAPANGDGLTGGLLYGPRRESILRPEGGE